MFMGISPGKLNSAQAATGRPAFLEMLHRTILYRGTVLLAMLACVAGFSAVGAAQEDRPQIIPGERQARKKDTGPRALALLRLSPDGKSSLLPVAILINGKFWDASAYKADPVPMALDYGVVYEAERTGSSMGLFTVSSALHSNAVNAPIPWIATGKWAPAGSEDAKKPLKAESVPVGVDSSDDRPRLTRNPAAVHEAPPASTTPAASKSQPSGGSSGDEPPRLSRGSSAPESTSGSATPSSSAPPSSTPPASTPSSSTPPSSAPSGSTPAGSSSPASPSGTDSKAGEAKAPAPPSGPADDSGVNEATRPRLRRGKPVAAFADEDIPGYSKPGAAPAAVTPASAGKPAQPAASGPAQLFPAISDASGPAPRSFTFQWLKDEEGERRKQMQALATQQVQAYLEALARNKISASPKPSSAQGARRTPARKTPLPILENVQMIAYDLWTNNQPVMVFAADAHRPPPAAGTAHAGTDVDVQYSIMMVARTDIYNNLHPLYVGVTDKYHLDVTPRLELIDAVDADGDGRGELLFRETSDAGTGWVIYRATADKMWKMFDSLNPE
jgi:hypothetical protein